MTKEAHYFKIGMFVLVSTALLIAGILFFGAAKYFEPKIYAESYFNESVQGLDIGSPVKYRGITIGHVANISTTNSIYSPSQTKTKGTYNRAIYVEMAITANKLKSLDAKSIKKDLDDFVKSGLRVTLMSQGFTGTSYLELVFLNPKDNKPLKFSWKPEHLYIPSSPSTYARFTETASKILSSLGKIDYEKVFNNINSLTVSSKKTLSNLQETSTSFNELADQLNAVTANIKAVTNNAKHYPAQMIWGNPPPKLNPKDIK